MWGFSCVIEFHFLPSVTRMVIWIVGLAGEWMGGWDDWKIAFWILDFGFWVWEPVVLGVYVCAGAGYRERGVFISLYLPFLFLRLICCRASQRECERY